MSDSGQSLQALRSPKETAVLRGLIERLFLLPGVDPHLFKSKADRSVSTCSELPPAQLDCGTSELVHKRACYKESCKYEEPRVL